LLLLLPRCCSWQVELQFGLVYDKYRLRCYYYECVVLLEKCLLTMLLVLLQSQPAALQVLVAMAVIFIETVVHVSEATTETLPAPNLTLACQ
jgi:hypothetical protein